jgi:hypothetical protein
MYEAIITLVELETQDGVTYPVTKIYRIEFDNKTGLEMWEDAIIKEPDRDFGIVHVEQLKGQEVQ